MTASTRQKRASRLLAGVPDGGTGDSGGTSTSAAPRLNGWQRLLRNRQALIGLIIIVVAILSAALAPLIAPYDPNVGDGSIRLAPIGTPGHLLGTDDQGRDMLSRLMWGGRSALTIGIVAVAVATVIGTALGLIAGFSGPRVSGLIMRVIDLMFAFPVILIALSLAAILSAGIGVVILTIVFGAVPYITRITFSEVKMERGKEYVEAAQSLGASPGEILRVDILPNIQTTIIVYGTSLVGAMIVLSSSLSALGIGVQPPEADWGRMISEGAKVLIAGSPHVATLPGLCVVVVALAFNWVGDGLRDVLDPQHSH